MIWNQEQIRVSVPIRGLFNLTKEYNSSLLDDIENCSFRPHQGII